MKSSVQYIFKFVELSVLIQEKQTLEPAVVSLGVQELLWSLEEFYPLAMTLLSWPLGLLERNSLVGILAGIFLCSLGELIL